VALLRSRASLALAATATLAATTFSTVPVTAAAAAPAHRSSGGSEFTLITGERVLETSDAAGRTQFSVVSGGGADAPVFVYRIGTARYFIDSEALRFVGRELDPALFDGALTAGGTRSGIPVVVHWRGASAPSMPWLVDRHAVAAGVTRGVVTASSGAVFRAALAREPASSRGSWTGPLSGVDHIGPASGVTTPPRESPLFKQFTLTIDGINSAGHPDTGDALIIVNTDNASKFSNFAVWDAGVIKLSVPTGHYSLFGQFIHFAKSGAASLSLVVMDVTVQGNTTAAMDARTATSQVSVATPRATSSGSGNVLWQRIDALDTGGVAAGVSWSIGLGSPPFRVYVSPSPAPQVGTQGWVVSFHLDSSPAALLPYTYDLQFGSVGAILAVQRYTVAASQLASIDTRYFSDVPNRLTGEIRSAFFPWQVFGGGIFDTFAAPSRRTEYVMALSDLVWSQAVVEDLNDFAGFFTDSNRLFRPGERATAEWGRAPSGPGVQVSTGAAAGLQTCPVCLENNTLEFNIYPFADSPPGHVGVPNTGAPGVTETDTATLTRDGVTIASGSDPVGPIPVPSGPAHYVVTYHVSMSAPWWTLSTATSTTWHFSTPQSLAGTPPAGWTCFSGLSARCSVVGLMFPDYQLPVGLLNQMPAGAVSFHLGIEHVLGAAIPIGQASVSVSFDGGVTWHGAQVSPHGGGFTVVYQNPPGPGDASLRLHVTDANGGVLDQTIINAYAIS
jgi:hypothetical protein